VTLSPFLLVALAEASFLSERPISPRRHGTVSKEGLIVIPAGVPHFVAAPEGQVIVQISGDGPFRTEFLEK